MIPLLNNSFSEISHTMMPYNKNNKILMTFRWPIYLLIYAMDRLFFENLLFE
jgi:hypothetical protein